MTRRRDEHEIRPDAQREVDEETLRGIEREIEERSRQASEEDVQRVEDELKKEKE